MTHNPITSSQRVLEPNKRIAEVLSGLIRIPAFTPMLLIALGLAGHVLPASAQGYRSVYRPLTLAPADASSPGGVGAGEDEKAKAAELAKQTLNPIASLISVPFQHNWDFGIGPCDAMRYTLNFQPVIPISLSQDWNVISRTILPTIYLESTAPGVGSKFGLGDTVQSFFFSPKESPRRLDPGGGPGFASADRHGQRARCRPVGGGPDGGRAAPGQGVYLWHAGQPHLVLRRLG